MGMAIVRFPPGGHHVVLLSEWSTSPRAGGAQPRDTPRASRQRLSSTELLAFLVHIARRQGLLGLTAKVLKENEPMLRVLEKVAGAAEHTSADESWDLRIRL
jgi:RimJ/RimL family protein N-acetyltransferase